ncbi:MAG: hypothetical protein GY722_02440 [bacterium]|nr:hypothetical protein [bacterium]
MLPLSTVRSKGAAIAAGLLEMQGVQPIVVAKGGVTDILTALSGSPQAACSASGVNR